VTEEPGYEVVGQGLDNEPGYEEIGRRVNENRGNVSFRMVARQSNRSSRFGNEEDAVADPGYEVVHFPDGAEPGYEMISKLVSRHNSEVAEPGYEVIKKRPSQPLPAPSPPVRRVESDLSTEPGYERVRFVRRNPSQTEVEVENEPESEPAYASITRRDIDESFSERL
jgi:hypothetical protein